MRWIPRSFGSVHSPLLLYSVYSVVTLLYCTLLIAIPSFSKKFSCFCTRILFLPLTSTSQSFVHCWSRLGQVPVHTLRYLSRTKLTLAVPIMPSFHRSTNLRSDGQAQRHEPISTSTSPSPSPSPLNLTPHRHPGLPDAACNLTLQQSPLSPFPENAYPRLIASNHQQQISVPRLRQRPPRSSITWTSTPIPSESIKRPRLKRARNLSSSAREHAARVRKIGACRSCRSKKIKVRSSSFIF